jgi:hypothetical protein
MYKLSRSKQQANLRYLTNRKKPKGCWEKFFYCFYPDGEEIDHFDPHEVVPVNSQLVEMMIFSGNNKLY